jgi:hypothetical protein
MMRQYNSQAVVTRNLKERWRVLLLSELIVSTADVVCSALLYRVIGALIKSDKLLLNYFLIGGVANACEEFLRGFFLGISLPLN